MKRIFNYILAAAAAVLVSGCVDNVLDSSAPDENQEANIITASIESAPTKTSLGSVPEGAYKPFWSEGDQIGVIVDNAEPSPFILSGGAGTSEGKFSGIGKGSSYVAYYPYSGIKSINGKSFKVILPSEQSYVPGSFGKDTYPMIAVSATEDMDFLNLCSVLKVSLKGDTQIGSIEFTSASTLAKVSGEATLRTDFTDVPSLTMSSLSSAKVTLLCDNVTLDPEKATDFYIVIPPQKYPGGFKLKISGPSGYMEVSAKEDVVMERSQLRAVPAFTFEPEPYVVPSTTLQGHGTQASPFLISSLPDLLYMRNMSNVSGGTINGVEVKTASFKQTADISLAQVCGKNIGSWIPIGDCSIDENLDFSGCYDGGSYKISDLYIKSDKNDRGLFGKAYGRVCNLEISGSVEGGDNVGLLAGSAYNVGGIMAEGHVKGNMYVGGIAGMVNSASYCLSKVKVEGNNSVGGVCGVANISLGESLSYSDVKGKEYVGGIVGNHNSGIIYNSVNHSNVEGEEAVGGVSGYSRQSGKVFNNVNYGDITGGYNVGGIVGYCSKNSSVNDPTTVSNCINYGTVESSDPDTAGSICGLNENRVVQNFWIYDPDRSLGMEKGVNDVGDAVSDNYPLTESQMKGESVLIPYYISGEDTFYDLADALTAWAADNSSSEEWNSAVLQGWSYSSPSGYPELSGKAAQKPEGGLGSEPVFKVSPTEVNLGPYVVTFTVKVTTNMDYSISSMPDWVTEKSQEETTSGYIHKFEAAQNTVSAPREGVIVFCNEEQTCVPVTVSQREAGSVGDEWKTKEFFHRSLAMRFTADWCGYCPTMATSVEMAKSLMVDKIEAVSMHTSGGLGYTAGSAVETRFNITGYPSLIVDARALIENYESSFTRDLICKVVKETERVYTPQTGISFTSSVEGSQLEVNMDVFIKEADDYKITVLLLEDNIVAYQNGQGESYVHNDVVRLALTDISGEAMEVDEDNSIWSGTFRGTIPAGCNVSNLRILAYIERPYGSQAVATGEVNVTYGSYGDTYVDNCRSEKVGTEAVLQYADDPNLGKLYESQDYSADGNVTVLQTATEGNGIDIVFMGDAFTDINIAEGLYSSRMNVLYENFFLEEPYKTYKNLFNVYSVTVVSKNGNYGGETALEGYFGEGTLVGGNDGTCFEYALNAIDEDRMNEALIIVLMNVYAYAGTCYMYHPSNTSGTFGSGPAVAYFPTSADVVTFRSLLHHEANGHGFAKLADEYSYEYMGEMPSDVIETKKNQQVQWGWWKNIDFTDNLDVIKWNYFLQDQRYANEGLGAYEGGDSYWSGVWHPTEESIMRHNTGGFNAPSREAIYYRIHKLAYGEDWEYDYEDFVEYDAKNRTTSSAASGTPRTNYVEKSFQPTAPPVVVNKSWRESR